MEVISLALESLVLCRCRCNHSDDALVATILLLVTLAHAPQEFFSQASNYDIIQLASDNPDHELIAAVVISNSSATIAILRLLASNRTANQACTRWQKHM
eukprot:18550-Heterococcus_DN1.PRE.2